jgi:threonine/homoserine/homoserine lactone efflux protein
MEILPLSTVLAYAGIAGLLVLAPGMSTAVVLRNTAEGGRRAGLLTALGIAVGNATWATAAGLGLGLVLRQSPGALNALRLAGAVFLAWLGLRSLKRAFDLRRGRGSAAAPPAHSRIPSMSAMFGEGAITNLLNPSIPVFYAATVPQFIGPGTAFVPAFLLLSGLHVTMALTCHSAYAIAFGGLATALESRGRAWLLHAATGAALLLLAAFSL